MESTFIKPNNEKIVIDDKNIYEFCKKECQNYINSSIENKLYFENYIKNYTYFNAYYDFVINELKYIHKGCLLDKTLTILTHKGRAYSFVDTECIDYEQLTNFKITYRYLYKMNDQNLDINSSYINESGYIDHNGILLSTRYYNLHSELAFALLLQITVDDYDICKDYLKQQNHDYSDYLVDRLGFIKKGIGYKYDVILYNVYLKSAKQREAMYVLKDYGCYDYERYSDSKEESKQFVLKFRSNYENRRI